MSRQSVMLEQDQIDELREVFKTIDVGGDGTIDVDELGQALEICGQKLPAYEIRDLIKSCDVNNDGKLSMNEFKALYAKIKREKDAGVSFKKNISTRKGVQAIGGASEGVTHTVKDTERFAFADWINRNLGDDPECKDKLPINPESDDLYAKVKDGILLCKLINKSVPDTIDERTINKTKLDVYRRTENHNLAINSASSIGCNVTNIGRTDLEDGKAHLVLGLIWQIIRIGLLSEVNLASHPGLVHLLEEGETIDDLLKLSPEEILIRWVNYHLRKAGINRQIANFSSDIKDSIAYIHLLHQIAPREKGIMTHYENDPDDEQRAECMLCEADKLGCRAFITCKDVVKGNAKLNLAFVANLFNNYPGLEKPDDFEEDQFEETREEKTYRNWMNSMGVNPHVNRLYGDLYDGIILFQLYDIIKPKTVDWDRVHKQFSKLRGPFEKIENANYAVELGKQMKFSLIGVSGKDIVDCNPTLTLALVWQLMRAYTLAILSRMSDDGHQVVDNEIIEWAKTKLAENKDRDNKPNRTFTNFKDQSLADGIVILQLIECISPKKINWDVVKHGGSEEDNLSNAKYAISMGRKIGARLYALPEDIVEVKPKMIMTIFACLMGLDLGRKQQEQD